MDENLKYTFSNVNDWLKFAEAKNIALATIDGAILFGIIQGWKEIPIWMHSEIKYILFPLLIISMLLIIWSFIPKLNYKKLKNKKNNPNNDKKLKEEEINVLYYGHIKQLSSSELLERLDENKNKTQIDCDLANQIIVNSKISWDKNIVFKRAGYITFWALIITSVAIIINWKFGWDVISFIKNLI